MKTQLSLGEVLDDLIESQCADAVQKRRELIGKCVGTLYPHILECEINKLTMRANNLHRKVPIQKEMY